MKFTLPLSIKIVDFDIYNQEDRDRSEQELEQLYNAGYSIIASGSTIPRETAAPSVRREICRVWFVMSTRPDLQN